MAAGLNFQVKGLAETVAALRTVASDIRREDTRANRELGRKVAEWGQADARRGDPIHRHFAEAIRGRGTGRAARIAILGTGRNAGAVGAFYGANRYRRYPWVGATFKLGEPGQGPYVVGKQTIPDHRDEIAAGYMDARERALGNVFNEGVPRG